MTLGKHFGQLVANALAAYRVDASGEFAHGSQRCGFDLESETRRKPHRAQETELVFFEPLFRAADGADDTRIEVVETSDVVNNFRAKIAGPRVADRAAVR